MKLPSDLRAFVESLNAARAKYVIVGGYAVSFHGHPRFTGDIDFFVDSTAENADAVVKAIDEFGFGSLGLKPEDFNEQFGLAVMDVSFISVTKVLPALIPLLKPTAKLIVLIKPQFEVGRGEVGKGGIVREPEKHERVVAEINEFVVELGLQVKGVLESPILGAEGNKEFLALYERES